MITDGARLRKIFFLRKITHFQIVLILKLYEKSEKFIRENVISIVISKINFFC